MTTQKKVNIVPCSGIGKSFGSVSRLAGYLITEDDRPQSTRLIPLAMLVLGDESTHQAVGEDPSITMDGCKLQCAKKMVEQCGGQIAKDYVVLDAFREHRELKPEGIAELNENGEKLARALADEVDLLVDLTIGSKKEETHA